MWEIVDNRYRLQRRTINGSLGSHFMNMRCIFSYLLSCFYSRNKRTRARQVCRNIANPISTQRCE